MKNLSIPNIRDNFKFFFNENIKFTNIQINYTKTLYLNTDKYIYLI